MRSARDQSAEQARRDIHHAGRAIRKLDLNPRTGASLVTWEEIEAMAALLAEFGVAPVGADRTVEDPIFVSVRSQRTINSEEETDT